MKRKKFCAIALIVATVSLAVCGCMNTKTTNANRKESDAEYILLVQEYMQDKYSKDFEVVESILPDGWYKTGLEENILVLKDKNGVKANVRARVSTPYEYYDDYVEACTAAQIQARLDMSAIDSVGNAKVYVVLQNEDIHNIDTTAYNVLSLTFVANIEQEPNEDLLRSLYNVYTQLQAGAYENMYMVIGFTDDSDFFDRVIDNYIVYGKAKWEDYSDKVYASLDITENDLTFEEFKAKLETY